MHKLQITARGLELNKPIKEYVDKKVSKISRMLKRNVNIHCEIINAKKNIEFNDSFIVELSFKLPKAYIKVEREGENFYEVVDEIEEVVKRQVRKYKGKFDDRKKIKLSEAMMNFS